MYRAFPKLAHSALAMEAAPFVVVGHPQFFSRDLREISPTLNEDLLELYGRSEQVLANTFAFQNVSETLAADFDWEKHPNAAWRRELHAFDYALSLAMIFRISQEERYALHLRYLIAHWIAQNAPGQTTGWELNPLARRVRNWALASDLAWPAWNGDRDFQDVFAQSLAMQCVFLSRRAREADPLSGFVLSGRALCIASRLFGRLAGARLAELGDALLSDAVNRVLDHKAGACLARPTDLLHLAEACLERLLFSPASNQTAREIEVIAAREVLSVLEGALLPHGTLPLFGPSARSQADELSDIFAFAAVVLDEPRWKNLAGRFGIFPHLVLGEKGKAQFERLSVPPSDSATREIPELGLYRLSAGSRSAMIINARPPLSHHDHQDFLSYELSLNGLRVIVDSGAYSPDGESDYFASAHAHNVLVVDGETPHPRQAGRREDEAPLPLIEYVNQLGIHRGDRSSTDANCLRLCLSESGFALPGVCHRRVFYCLDGTAWAVLDRLDGEGCFPLVNLIHFFPAFEIELHQDRAIARSRAMSVTIIPIGACRESGNRNLVIQVLRGPDAKFPGFYSPDFGVKFRCAVLQEDFGQVRLPWVGGYVIVPGDKATFHIGAADARGGSVEFELYGRPCRFDLSY